MQVANQLGLFYAKNAHSSISAVMQILIHYQHTSQQLCNKANAAFHPHGVVSFISWWRPLVNYVVKAGVVCWQVKLCDPHLNALEVRFSRRGAIQIDV